MKTLLSILLNVIIFTSGYSQDKYELKITGPKENLSKSKLKKNIYEVTLVNNIHNRPDPDKDKFKDYKLKVEVDLQKSTLPYKDFEMSFEEIPLSKIRKDHKFFISILPDSEFDRQREIYLKVSISHATDTDLKKISNDIKDPDLTLKVLADSAVRQYNYLAYIGTNFDLVDGIKAKNLFFATNIFRHPIKDTLSKKKGIGFSLTLYGNRTLSATENMGTDEYTYKLVPIPDKDSAFVHRQRGQRVRTRVSDNLGAAFSPVLHIGKLSNEDRIIQVFYAPQVEFIWRRATTTDEYTNVEKLDSTGKTYFRGGNVLIQTPASSSRSFNYYDFNLGLFGWFASHETEDISLRFQIAGGYSFRYSNRRGPSYEGDSNLFERQGNWYFGARAWITEPTSGLTLGAEVTNRLFNNYEPFYNVTLSKAISFNHLGSIFAPITSR
jgi:hypothetical protein